MKTVHRTSGKEIILSENPDFSVLYPYKNLERQGEACNHFHQICWLYVSGPKPMTIDIIGRQGNTPSRQTYRAPVFLLQMRVVLFHTDNCLLSLR